MSDARILAAARAVGDIDGECWLDQATAFTCGEIETLAELFRALGQKNFAALLISTHAEGDEEGDAHYTEEVSVND